MAKDVKNEFLPNYASPPGDTLQEETEYRGITPAELALRTSQSLQYVTDVFVGIAAITPDFAAVLERELGIDAEFWNNRERYYQEALARLGRTRPQRADAARNISAAS